MEIDGKQYLCHEVKMNDTLVGLSIRFNVGTHLIKRANNLLNDFIFQKKELLIPVVPGMKVKIAEPDSVEYKLK